MEARRRQHPQLRDQMLNVIAVVIAVELLILIITGGKMAEDFTALNAAIAKLQTDVTTLIASKAQSNQAAIDAATAAVNAVDASVTAATPPPAPAA